MSIEGLWSVEFISNASDAGAGVIVFETGRLFGGDSSYYYLGTYTVEADASLHFTASVDHFSGPPSSIFGTLRHIDLVIVGRMNGDLIEAQGHLRDDPSRRLALRLKRLADLP